MAEEMRMVHNVLTELNKQVETATERLSPRMELGATESGEFIQLLQKEEIQSWIQHLPEIHKALSTLRSKHEQQQVEEEQNSLRMEVATESIRALRGQLQTTQKRLQSFSQRAHVDFRQDSHHMDEESAQQLSDLLSSINPNSCLRMIDPSSSVYGDLDILDKMQLVKLCDDVAKDPSGFEHIMEKLNGIKAETTLQTTELLVILDKLKEDGIDPSHVDPDLARILENMADGALSDKSSIAM